MARLWAMTATYPTVQVGDHFPVVVKWETAESIHRYLSRNPTAAAATADTAAVATAAAIDSAGNAADTPQVLPAMLAAYVRELIEKGLPLPPEPPDALQLDFQTHAPVWAMDTVSLSGRVTGKRETAGRQWIDCQVTIENQDGQLIATAAISAAL